MALVTSSDTSSSVVNVNNNNNSLNLLVNGTAVNISLTAGARTKNDIANSINTALGVNGSATVVNNAITLTSATKGRGGTIEVLAGTGNAQLGFTASATPTFGTSRTGQSVADALKQHGVLVHPAGPQTLRACTHLDISALQAERAAEIIRKSVPGVVPVR